MDDLLRKFEGIIISKDLCNLRLGDDEAISEDTLCKKARCLVSGESNSKKNRRGMCLGMDLFGHANFVT